MKYRILKRNWFYGFMMMISIQSVVAQDVFVEQESLVVVEIESAPLKSEWKVQNTSISGNQIKYYAAQINDYNNPGRGILSYKIKINSPGTYRFQWHCKVGHGNSPTNANDIWLKIPDADDFYAEKLSSGHSSGHSVGHIVHPRGGCTSDCPEGAGKNGWFKVYSNGTVNWTWRSSTNDNDPHAIFARFDNAGTYTIQISARSQHHFLNRFVLYKPEVHSETNATSLSSAESTVLTPTGNKYMKKNDLFLFPNPATDKLRFLKGKDQFVRFEVLSLNGKILFNGKLQETIDVSGLAAGFYFVNLYDKTNTHYVQKIQIKK